VDWDSLIHKGVRTKDMEPVGNVTAATNNSIVITSEGARDEFNVPKEEVEAFNGAEVYQFTYILKLFLTNSSSYEV
jgi:hypothetical protein